MKITIKNARLSFNTLWEAKSFQGGDPKFDATLICTDDTKIVVAGSSELHSHKKLNKVAEKVLVEKFGKCPKKFDNWVYNKADGSTTRGEYTNSDGDYWDGFTEDTWYISASKPESKCKNGKMVVVDQSKDRIEASDGKLFSGCYVNAIIDVFPFEVKSGKGVSASLEGIQLLRKGEALGFTVIDAESDFDEEENSDVEDML